MVLILFLDNDPSYCQRVCSRLHLASSRFRCFDRSSYCFSIPVPDNQPKALDLGLLGIDWETTLVVYHPQQYFDPPEKAYVMILSESLEDRNDGSTDSAELPIDRIYKYDSMQAMLSSLEAFIERHPDLSNGNGKGSLMCIVGTACPLLRHKELDRIRQEKFESGLKVIQIDFCPPYLGDCPDTPSHGYSLSDALLRLMAEDISSEDLGMYLMPRADGTLQFRPMERADDLFECKPAHIRRFVELVREWMIHSNDSYTVFIQCSAIPFSFVYAAAVLCDVLLILNSGSGGSSAVSYGKELGFLLANLPGSCRMEEIALYCPGIESDRKDGFL